MFVSIGEGCCDGVGYWMGAICVGLVRLVIEFWWSSYGRVMVTMGNY